MRYAFLLSLALLGCTKSAVSTSDAQSITCRGIYYERDAQNVLHKYNQYELNGQCYTDNLQLSRFETTQEAWNKNHTSCTPQPTFVSQTLVASNNYYNYRDGKAFLDFNSSTGVYRRIILAEDKDGNQVYTRLQGCYYARTATGVDSSFGQQLLLDNDVNKIITDQNFDPMEIFQVTVSGSNVDMVRFDDMSGYDYRSCPTLNTPWAFCTILRTGNEFFFPDLTTQQEQDLTNEAILITKQFNWTISSSSQFDTMWNNPQGAVTMREDYKYDVIHVPDTPYFIDQSWRDFVMNNRPTMPDVSSSTIPPICYPSSQDIVLANGQSGKIYGQACYVSGQYFFTGN